ncbi:folate-binding protein [Pelagibacteraceae bacterium]|jgi:folate-binding protein YgfZ|nr:folate-binding protein [Pelagibacteraceae bacterium]|tara:strand:- start:772 stop:1647 length:876 start_codon:yes stop_codon:yes gene_type:complete
MKKDQIIILKKRGLISISGEDAKDFLQNIITNDVDKVSESSSIFAALLNPQGKYLFEFFVIKTKKGYLLDCDGVTVDEFIENLSKYIIRSKVKIKNLTSDFVVSVINLENFKLIQKEIGNNFSTLIYRDTPIFLDPRHDNLGARIVSPLEKLYLTIKKLKLKIVDSQLYPKEAHIKGVPIEGLKNLQNQIFALELNFEKLNAIDFKKGCYIGQENTARMKLKNKVRRQLLAIKAGNELKVGDEIKFNDITIGKILINKPYPFAIVKLMDPEFSTFKNEKLKINDNIVELIL